ncbi:hypothetical protein Spa11_14200 [Botrimarina mediterranea]|uniref:Uncharacterized protein n=1 Tax=Botrimarina mediterranea TaxID=2528022 RepID=A0A518K602_9BACT|nr:hypothetical protein Spa11_14200 [Botrimarina mediterranea]
MITQTNHEPNHQSTCPHGNAPSQAPESTTEHDRQQARLYEAYIEQQRRMHCPSCGESPQLF